METNDRTTPETAAPVFDPTKKVTLELNANELGFLANAMNFTVSMIIKNDPLQALQYGPDIYRGLMEMGPLGYNTLNVAVEKLIQESFPGLFATEVLQEPTNPAFLPADYKSVMGKSAA